MEDLTNKAAEMLDRMPLFKKTMTMLEHRELSKVQENPGDLVGLFVGMLWLVSRREDRKAKVDTFWQLTEEQLIEQLDEKLPKASTKN